VRLQLVASLTDVAVWEAGLDALSVVTWHIPLTRVLGMGSGTFWVPMGGGGRERRRPVAHTEVASLLLDPVLESLRAGIHGDGFELRRRLGFPDGQDRTVEVRAVTVPGGDGPRVIGTVGVAGDTAAAGWSSPEASERLRLLVENSPDAVIVHQDGILVYANAAAARLVGVASPEVGIGQRVETWLRPDQVVPMARRLAQLREPGDVAKGHELIVRRADGTEITVESAGALTTWAGRPAYQVILHDISERKAAEEATRARLAVERRYATAVAVLEEAVLVFDADGAVLAANESAVRILGRRLHWGLADAVLTGGGPAWSPDDATVDADALPIAQALARRAVRSRTTIGVLGEDGNRQWLSVNTRRLGDDHVTDGAVVVCSVSDVTERKQLMDRLAWEARNDALTGVLNRTGLVVQLQALLDDAGSAGGVVLLAVDIDRFKMVNGSVGHAAGDEVLRAFAHRLSAAVRGAGLVGRLYADTFAVVLTEVADADGAVQRAEALQAAVNRPLRLASGRTLNLATSIGVVRAGHDLTDAARLLQDADLARLEAKSRHRGRVALFDVGLRAQIGGRLELEHDLRAAVANGELRVEYQPMASLGDGHIIGVEALVRWEHPQRGLLMPDRFIELAEESELIVTLGTWVLVQSFTQMARWRARHPAAADAFVAVNVSPRQLEGDALLPAIDEALGRSGLPPSAVVLEITESGFVAEDPHVLGVLHELRASGLRLAVDDFGAGYSSLGQLKRLPVSFLKVDRSFVEGLGRSEQDDHIVSVVAQLGHTLGMQIIAEGIEDERQRHAAARLGCDIYQGYLLARPEAARVVDAQWSAERP
jgi:diguanylate cyclase (GGDEF)-like protein/PAS domain S-box-containing protein